TALRTSASGYTGNGSEAIPVRDCHSSPCTATAERNETMEAKRPGTLIRSCVVSIATGAVCVVLSSSLGQAHKENSMTSPEPVKGTTSSTSQAASKAAIRPFRVNMPEEALADLRRRINATQWPDREAVADASQGVQLATVQKLARYW